MTARTKKTKPTKYLRPPMPLKWHGGKYYLAPEIVKLFPPKRTVDPKGYVHYVEPYFGGGAVLLANDPQGISEVVNDVDSHLTNFWVAMKYEDSFAVFKRRLDATPFSQAEWQSAKATITKSKGVSISDAVEFYVGCRQSLAGRFDSFAPITRERTRGGMNEQASAWMGAVEGLPLVHARMMRVVILKSSDALKVIRSQNGEATLFYLDPPYYPETRASKDVYRHEMSERAHALLLLTIGGRKTSPPFLDVTAYRELKGKESERAYFEVINHNRFDFESRFVLSGYRCDLYDRAASIYGWNRREFDLPNNAASGKSKQRKIECVWRNYT